MEICKYVCLNFYKLISLMKLINNSSDLNNNSSNPSLELDGHIDTSLLLPQPPSTPLTQRPTPVTSIFPMLPQIFRSGRALM